MPSCWHNDRVNTHETPAVPLIEALEGTRELLRSTTLPLATASAPQQREDAARAVAQLDDYVLPRVRSLDAPLLAVVGGSTGAGKSTLVNALVGHPVTRSGAIRPTTRRPLLIHHPSDAGAFTTQRVLPRLARVHGTVVAAGHTPPAGESGDGTVEDTGSLVLLADTNIPEGLAILDAPDVDSISDDNRALAAQLLSAADLWLFVTTANRYADAVPWQLLRNAAGRDITVAVVLDRVQASSAKEIEDDLRRMLDEEGLGAAPIFVVTESPLNETGMLPAAAVEPVREWLERLGADAQARSEIAARTLGGAVRELADTTERTGEAVAAQQRTEEHLRREVSTSFGEALRAIVDSTRDGTLLRGEVLSRWQDFVGTGEFFRSLEAGIGRVRDRMTAFFKGQPTPEVRVEEAIETGLQAVIVENTARAAESAERRWRDEPSGQVLLAGRDASALPPDYPEQVAESIRAWQSDVMLMIQQEGAGKRTRARAMSLGVNALAVILMIAVFSTTGGLTGLEVGIAGGSGVVGMKLLEAVFGEDAVRRMSDQARSNLESRIQGLLDQRAKLFLDSIDELGEHPTAQELHAAAELVRRESEAL
ncbi:MULTISPECIES: dynamin family protein [Kocuria]|uniref:Dynamin family protein n=1 Tax=Kocuria salsicia TaxID=664639 RepID=A0ABV3K8R9_9MICC|nr:MULTISPECIES: dynamin family protein [Kocuria]MBS6029975.1 dynamin family protein [Kocuria rhizophila]